ncbi:YhdH/YhfP family quinone oxidoreductase [uncultured Ilyobacter sp.]|uniref:YhdH/YhfP family quinone oxidoreductase n=1 Tax=uncultured Ilyobacter sp. TaxID=544433 RepID=UPI0029C90995|nr:YhdH/YhfP family quinone oxidoreductase [uncultured Ilyobacter sp.]
MKKFRAVRIFEENGKFIKKIVERDISELPEGEVLIKVRYSSLNYKDALSCIGNKGITRKFPHTPGIDAAGIVVESESKEFEEGDEVLAIGYDLGMNTDGGFGEYIRVPVDWVVKRPEKLTLKEAMIYGTAGYTAGQSVYELVSSGVKPEDGEILVSGATGGVGSHSVRFLSKLGYDVVAVVNGETEEKTAIAMGAKRVISREEAVENSDKALLSQKWAGAIDTVGGATLSTMVRSIKFGGTVTTCGNVTGAEMPGITVFPFILRAVKLIGIASAYSSKERRKTVWEKLADEWKSEKLHMGIKEVGLDGILQEVDNMLDAKLVGRVILVHAE